MSKAQYGLPILVTGAEHPYMANWWVPGAVIGYEHTFVNALADFLKGLETGEPARPTLRDALQTQLVLDAVLESAKTGKPIPVLLRERQILSEEEIARIFTPEFLAGQGD